MNLNATAPVRGRVKPAELRRLQRSSFIYIQGAGGEFAAIEEKYRTASCARCGYDRQTWLRQRWRCIGCGHEAL